MMKIAMLLAWLALPWLAVAEEVQLAHEGRALLPVVVAADAPEEVAALADELAQGLGRMTGGTFVVERGKAERGIFVGTSAEWPGLLPKPEEGGESAPLAREDYRLRTGKEQLWLVGRTPLAVQNAVWDLLYRLGFRQYLPGAKWEMWPHRPSLSVEVDAVERPDYFTRRLRVGNVGAWEPNRSAVEEWKRRNRMVSGFSLSSGHVYGRIVQQNAAFFAANPGAYTGSERDPKLDASYPGMLEIVEAYVNQTIKADPGRDSISMEPSDGSGWREDSPLGSPSNQAVVLANHAAEVLREIAPGRKVGIYAYHLHSPPPQIRVDRDVVAGVATSFIKGGYTAEVLMEGWRKQGAEIGVREYLGVSSWDYGLPGRARAADVHYLATTIPRFYELGARYWDAEATESWGVHGLGHFLTARLLWDTGEAARVDAVLEEFYTRSFGNAAGTMRRFYETCLLKSGKPLLSEDLIGRMYRLLDEALGLEASPEVSARIFDLVLYTRYVELMFRYQNSERSQKEAAFRELVRLAEGNSGSMMFDRWLFFREIPGRTFRVSKREVRKWLAPTLAEAEPLGPEALRQMAREGGQKYPPLPFEVASFSGELRPAPFDELPAGKTRGFTLRGNNRIVLHREAKDGPAFEFTVKGGIIYRDRGNVELRLFSEAHPVLDEPVATASIPPDQTEHSVRLASPYAGAHHLEIRDGSGGTRVEWPEGQRAVFPASADEGTTFHGTLSMVFYVPEGAKVVGGYSYNQSGQLLNAAGDLVYDFSQMEGPGYFSVEVSPGEGGACWKLQNFKGRKILLTVPPYLARSSGELLLPGDVDLKTP